MKCELDFGDGMSEGWLKLGPHQTEGPIFGTVLQLGLLKINVETSSLFNDQFAFQAKAVASTPRDAQILVCLRLQ